MQPIHIHRRDEFELKYHLSSTVFFFLSPYREKEKSQNQTRFQYFSVSDSYMNIDP